MLSVSFGAKFWAFRGFGNQMGLLCLSEQILDFFGLLEQKTVFSSLFLWVQNFGVFAKFVCFVYFSSTHLVFCGAWEPNVGRFVPFRAKF